MLQQFVTLQWSALSYNPLHKNYFHCFDRKETAKPDASEDPQAGIMNLMQKMYDDGDDDMKRTIAKAWSESQEKKAAGDFTP